MKNKTKKKMQNKVNVKSKVKTKFKIKNLGLKILISLFIVIFLYCIGCIIVSKTENSPIWLSNIFSGADIANTAIGALLGFGASLFLENYVIGLNRASAIDNIVAEIKAMESLISKGFSDNIKKNGGYYHDADISALFKAFDDKRAYDGKYVDALEKMVIKIDKLRYALYIPIWDSVLQNGDLLQFKNKEYFDSLIKVYTYILKIKSLIDDFESSSAKNNFFNINIIYKEISKLNNAIEDLKEFKDIAEIFQKKDSDENESFEDND